MVLCSYVTVHVNNVDSRQMNDSLSKSIQEQQKWIAELKEFEKECKEGTRHQDPGKQRR